MRLRVGVFGVLGTVATVLAVAVVIEPGFVESVSPLRDVADGLGERNRRHLLLAASILVGGFLSVVGWRASRSARTWRDAFDEATAEPPEEVTAARQRMTAADLDGVVDAAIDGDEAATVRVRERLREVAARAYARSADCEMDDARAAIRRGTWTDDRTAAAVLADDDGPSFPVRSRLWLWLDPERERERRFDRTVQVITRHGEVAS